MVVHPGTEEKKSTFIDQTFIETFRKGLHFSPTIAHEVVSIRVVYLRSVSIY